MRRLLLAGLFFAMSCTVSFSQSNVQFHYDYGAEMYDDDLKDRPEFTVTFENASQLGYGFSTYFFLDANFAKSRMIGAYTELSVDKRLFRSPMSLHVEYNGGLYTDKNGKKGEAYNDAYLAGLGFHEAGNYTNNGCFSLYLLYKNLANHPTNQHSWQVTGVWNYSLLSGLFTFSGFMDLWHDNDVSGNLVFLSEPQLWFNFNSLLSGFNLSVGTEVEISSNFIYFTDGSRVPNDRVGVCPTLAAKWSF